MSQRVCPRFEFEEHGSGFRRFNGQPSREAVELFLNLTDYAFKTQQKNLYIVAEVTRRTGRAFAQSRLEKDKSVIVIARTEVKGKGVAIEGKSRNQRTEGCGRAAKRCRQR